MTQKTKLIIQDSLQKMTNQCILQKKEVCMKMKVLNLQKNIQRKLILVL
jgi:hypothetical protein